jgi:hypothetical protein
VIEFLFWAGCPSHQRALDALTETMSSVGIEATQLRVTEILSEDEAAKQRFIGSPTIRIDGADLVDPGDTPFGLDCRVYFRRDGRPSPLPDHEDLRTALSDFAQRHQPGD